MVVILWVSWWYKNKKFWQRFTCSGNSIFLPTILGPRITFIKVRLCCFAKNASIINFEMSHAVGCFMHGCHWMTSQRLLSENVVLIFKDEIVLPIFMKGIFILHSCLINSLLAVVIKKRGRFHILFDYISALFITYFKFLLLTLKLDFKKKLGLDMMERQSSTYKKLLRRL